jgi:hypothetical protein
MKTKLVVDLPDIRDLVADLRLRQVHPALSAAEGAEAEAERRLEDAKRRLADHRREADALPAAVAAGHATPGQLEAALVRARASALIVPQCEAAVKLAHERVEAEHAAALRRLREVAIERQAALHRAAAAVSPLLEQLKESERALDEAAFREGVRQELPPVRWPQSVEDECAFRVARNSIEAAAKPAKPAA